MEVVLSIGSNCGDKIQSVKEAAQWAVTVLLDVNQSDVYLSPSVGNSKGDYANCVLRGEYEGELEQLIRLCKVYEADRGRNNECRMAGLVPVDIDVVMANGEILKPWDFRQNFFKRGYHQLHPALV